MKRKEAIEARYNVVTKSNTLIQQSRYNLTTQQQRMILYIISMISPQDKDFKTYEIDIASFCQTCGIDYISGRTYEELKQAIKSLADKSMWLEIEDGNATTLIRWIETATIRRNSGTIEVTLNKHLKPYLLELKKNFTSYELIYTLHLRSKYSIRLYELCCSLMYNTLKEYKRIFKIDELRKRLGADGYTDFRDFRRRVLDVAVKDITEYSDKNIEYNLITTRGRKIDAVELVITSKDSIESAKIRSDIDHELGLNDGQLTLFDEMIAKGLLPEYQE